MAVISAQFFVSTILAVPYMENCKVSRFCWVAVFSVPLGTHQFRQIHQVAFTLFASRVPEIRAETQEAITSIMAQIVTQMSVVMPSLQHAEIISEAISTLLSIGESASSREETALTNVMPVIIDLVEKHLSISQVITVLPVLK